MDYPNTHALWRAATRATVAAAAALWLAGCAQTGGAGPTALLASSQQPEQAPKPAAPQDLRSELQKATDYWGKAYAKNPRDAQTALNYARNLKALGEKRQALAVLQQTALFNGNNRAVLGEYGRVALELDQVTVAQKLLEQADDPANPDWRIISARGTVFAKQGRYQDALPFYERALTLAPNQASVLNNLALAHAMEGYPEKAEPLLKRAEAAGGHEARVSENLAIVLGLQGKYDEAKLAAANHLPTDKAAADVEYLKRLVKLEPKTAAEGAEAEQGTAKAAATKKASVPTTTSALPDRIHQAKATPAQAKKSTKSREQDAGSGQTEEAASWSTQVVVANKASR
jgi:Flp pilus assembly protein TadD